MAMYEGDAGLLHEQFNTRAQLLNNELLALCHLGEVERLSQLCQLCIVAECFRGDASAVQTGATCEGTFHDDHLQALLGCILGSTIASGAAADDQ